MDNELFSAIVDAARRGVMIQLCGAWGGEELTVKVIGVDDRESDIRHVNTTDPVLMVAAIRQLTEQVCR